MSWMPLRVAATRSRPRATTNAPLYGDEGMSSRWSGAPASDHARAGRTASSGASSAPEVASWATTPTISTRVQRLRMLSPNERGAPTSSSTPSMRAASVRPSPKRASHVVVTATSVADPGAGRRPASTEIGRSSARRTSAPTMVSNSTPRGPRSRS